jgi:flavin-dependent dehydrogenase
MINSFPSLKEYLHGVRALDPPLALGPMQRTSIAPIADGVILIGDAAGYVDAITGDGISLALSQAISLEQSVIPVLKNKEREGSLIRERELMQYQKMYGSLVKPYNRMTRLALLLVRFPQLVDPVIAILGHNQRLFQYMISKSQVKLHLQAR